MPTDGDCSSENSSTAAKHAFRRSRSSIQDTKRHLEISGPSTYFRDGISQAKKREEGLKSSQLTPAVKNAAINVVRELQQLQDEFIRDNPGTNKNPRSEFIRAPWGQLDQLNRVNDLQRQHRMSEGRNVAGTWKHAPIKGFESPTEVAAANLLLTRNRLMAQEDDRRRKISWAHSDQAARTVQRVWNHYKVRKIVRAAMKSKWRLLKRLVFQEIHYTAIDDVQQRRKLALREKNLQRRMSTKPTIYENSTASPSFSRSMTMGASSHSPSVRRNMLQHHSSSSGFLPSLDPFSSEPSSASNSRPTTPGRSPVSGSPSGVQTLPAVRSYKRQESMDLKAVKNSISTLMNATLSSASKLSREWAESGDSRRDSRAY